MRSAPSRYWRCLLEAARISMAKSLAYRANFVMGLVINLAGNLLFPLVTILIYGSGASFPDWSVYQVLLVQAIFTMANGLSACLFSGVFWATNQRVRDGSFEVLLIKPIDCLFFLVCDSLQPESLALWAGGLAMAMVSLGMLGWPSPLALLCAALFFLAGLAVMFGVVMVMAATAFKWIGNSRIPEIFDSLLCFAQYPQSIFPKALQAALSFFFPVAMVGFFPAQALLGRTSPAYFLALIPCLGFAALGVGLYRYMIRLYEGGGG